MFTIENKFYNNLKSIGLILISALVNIAISFQFSNYIMQHQNMLSEKNCIYDLVFSVIFLLALFFTQLFINWILASIQRKFHVILLTPSSTSLIKYFSYFIASVLFIIIIGIKDSVFEFYWINYVNESPKDKITIKLMMDIILGVLQATSIIFSYTAKHLDDSLKSPQ